MRLVLYLLSLALLATPVLGQSTPTQEFANPVATPDQKTIQQIEDDLLNAERTINPSVFEKVLADDYVNLTPHGMGPGKAHIVADVRRDDGKLSPYTAEAENMHIFILGDTAVTAFTKIYTAKENGNVAREDTTHIFQKDHGAWKLKLSRATQHSPELE